MRNYIKIIGLILVIPLAFSSCKDDENEGASLVGTWDEVSFVSSGCTDSADNENFTCTSSCERIVVTESTVKFGSDPALSYTINGNQIMLTQSGSGITITITVTFVVTETTLTITQQDDVSDGGCKNVSTYTRV